MYKNVNHIQIHFETLIYLIFLVDYPLVMQAQWVFACGLVRLNLFTPSPQVIFF